MTDAVGVDWPGLATAVRDAGKGLYPDGGKRFEARFHQVITYSRGDFFHRHRDAKKSVDHVATLVVDAGDLSGTGLAPHVVSFDNGEDPPRTVYGQVKDEDKTTWMSVCAGSWCAWHCSEFHEIPRVTSPRVVVVYNLCLGDDDDDDHQEANDDRETSTSRWSHLGDDAWRLIAGFAGAPAAARFRETSSGAVSAVSPYFLRVTDCEAAVKEARRTARVHGFRYAGCLLEHAYSLDGVPTLGLGNLRGRDAQVVDILTTVLGTGLCLKVVPAELLVESYKEDDGAAYTVRIAETVTEVEDVDWEEMDYDGDPQEHFGYNPFFHHSECDADMFISKPFRDVVWCDTRDSSVVEYRPKDPDAAFEDLWGNAAQFDIFCYKDVALLIDLIGSDLPTTDYPWYAPDLGLSRNFG